MPQCSGTQSLHLCRSCCSSPRCRGMEKQPLGMALQCFRSYQPAGAVTQLQEMLLHGVSLAPSPVSLSLQLPGGEW